MKKLLTLILAVCGFAAAWCDVKVPPEPQVIKPLKWEPIAFEPYSPHKLKEYSDDMLSLHLDNTDGDISRYYLRYDWDKPAVVYSLSMADGQKLTSGRELMVVQPEGRSKGKIKTNIALRVARINPKIKPAAALKKGEWIACFETIVVTHD